MLKSTTEDDGLAVSGSLHTYSSKSKENTHFNNSDPRELEDVVRCGEVAGFLEGCGRNRTMLSLAGSSCLPVASPTAGTAR